MELQDTVKLMNSTNFQDRFKAEYRQLKIRTEKLDKILRDYENGTLPFELKCPPRVLFEQSDVMKGYLRILETRALFEDIDLKN